MMIKTMEDYSLNMERNREVIRALKKRNTELDDEIYALSEALDFEREYSKQVWISVEDRLPDSDYQNVLVFCHGGKIQTTKFHSDRFAFKWPKSNCYTRASLGKLSGHFMLSHDSGYKVTHWMPLPEPPKEQGE
jgi:hypothetical protein